mmetsp:Transcript_87074/g.144836  ORF Transcript_87074/g.144836 Transcript_87074/m.144836 type:complete len:226 (+) Transcript_87074:3308-3985(+)
MERRIGVGNLIQERLHGPAGLQHHVIHNTRVLQRVHHQSVRALLVPTAAQFLRQQIAGRPRESQASPKQHVTPDLLPRGAELHHLMRSMRGEHELVEVPVNDVGQQSEQLEQLLHLHLIALLQKSQGHNLIGIFLGLGLGGLGCQHSLVLFVSGLVHSAGQNRPSSFADPLLISLVGLAQFVRPGLFLEAGPETGYNLQEVAVAQPFVPVCEDAQANDDIRMGKL